MKLEKILVCLFVIGLIMKFMHVPMAGVTLTISILALSLLYLGFSWWLLADKGQRRERLAISIVAGILFSYAPLGILFKIQYWPGAGITLLASIISCSILLIVTMLNYQHADTPGKKYFSGIILRAAIFAVLCSALYITPMRTLVRLQYLNHLEEAEIRADYYEHPENEEYKKKFLELDRKK